MSAARSQRHRGRLGAARIAALTSASIISAGVATAAAVSPGTKQAAAPPAVRQFAGGNVAQKAGLGRADGPLHVAALGDSVPSGYGTSQSYVDMVGNSIARQQGRPLAITNEAVNGATSADTEQALSDPNSAASQAVAAADLTVIEVGANDFDESSAHDPSCAPVRTSGCYADEMAVMKLNVADLLQNVKKLAKPGSQIVVLGYWNDFTDGRVGESSGTDYVEQGRALARWTNSVLQADAKADGLTYADAYSPFFEDGRDITSLLQADGDHPNEAGHQVIADAVLGALGSDVHA